MKIKRIFSFITALFLICSQPFILISGANNDLASSETGNVGNADDFITASGSIGGTVSLSGYLSASGIYLSASGSTFSDVEIELGNLWDAYRSTVQGVKDLADYTGSVVRGGYVLAKNAWNAFGGFARWLKNKFNLTDNLDNVSLNNSDDGGGQFLSMSPLSLGGGRHNNTSFSNIQIKLLDSDYKYLVVYYATPDVYGGFDIWFYNAGNTRFAGNIQTLNGYNETLYVIVNPKSHVQWNSNTYINTNFNPDLQKIDGTNSFVPPNIDDVPEESILSVDTSEIIIPDDIPDGATGGDSVGGILIPAVGAGVGGAAGAIAGAIIDGVMGGVMPDIDIKPADVNIPPNMEIDDDGNVFPNDLDFRPTDVFLDSDSYKLDMLNNYFPFSIPWDLLHFAAMFRAEPEIPIIDFVLPMPEGIEDIVINVDLTPFEPVAALSRSGLFVLFAIRWLMFLYRKFG